MNTVSDEVAMALDTYLWKEHGVCLGKTAMLAALEAVAPLLRAPAEQGGRVDGFEDWWERTESDVSSPHDAAKSAWQAALAQNAQGEEGKAQWDEVARILGADGDNVDDVFAKAKAHAERAQNAQWRGKPWGYVEERAGRETTRHHQSQVMRDQVLSMPVPELGITTPVYLHAEHAREPEGWVLVPREPTEEMIEAAFSSDSPDDDPSATPDYAAAYKAMLAAAPSQPEDAA